MFDIRAIVDPCDEERAAIEELARDCDRVDGTATEPRFDKSLNFRKGMPSWFLAYAGPGGPAGEGRLAGYLSVFAPEASTAEVEALVIPASRRRGAFAALLRAAEAGLRDAGYQDILLLRDAASAAAGPFLEAWARPRGAVLDHREFSMRLERGRIEGRSGVEASAAPPSACAALAPRRIRS